MIDDEIKVSIMAFIKEISIVKWVIYIPIPHIVQIANHAHNISSYIVYVVTSRITNCIS